MARKVKTVKKESITDSSDMMIKMENFFTKQLPALPQGVKDFIVNFGPWLIALNLLSTLPALFVGNTFFLYMSPMMNAFGRGYGAGWGLSWWIVVATSILNLLSLPGLFKKQMSGWNLAYLAVWVNLIGSLIRFDLVSVLVGGGLGFYLLFQVKKLYR